MASSPSHPSLRWVRSLVFIVFLQASSSSRVSLVNNGYNGLVIGIDDKLDVNECHKILANVQTLVNEASSYLYTATNRRAFFSDVTVVIPSAWPRGCTVEPPGQATTESYLTSDLRVSGPHPVHGTAPWTQQWGLCGQPGAFIQLASDYVFTGDNATYGDQARVLVHEWAKYRWGVFAELGFAGDPLYPSFYQQSAGQWRATGCADANVLGTVSPPGCQESSNQCTSVPFINDTNAPVTSSIMYMQALPEVRNFCDDGNHNGASPTKHNLLCNERSVWEVMQDHKDFKDGNNPPLANDTIPTVDFRVVKATTDRFFFLLESTVTMRQQKRWDFLTSSIRKFINWDVPTGLQVGIGHFGRTYMIDKNLTAVPDSLAGRMQLASMPPIADNVTENLKSWMTGIDGALNAMGAAAKGSTLIWVTGNEENSAHRPTDTDIDYIIARLQQKQTRLMLVFYPAVTPGLARIALETGGDVIAVSDARNGEETKISVFHSLAAAYDFALEKYISSRRLLRVQVEDSEFAENVQNARGRFLLDNTLGVNTTLTVIFSQQRDVGYIRIRPPGGALQVVYGIPDGTNHLLYVNIDEKFQGPQQGEWEYEIDLTAGHDSIFVQVSSSAGSSLGTVRTQLWTSVDAQTRTLNATRQPLIVYASVMKDNAPVLDVQVTAVIRRPSSDGPGERDEISIQLLDNGLGVPDILHGDGIYARYFTDFGSIVAEPPALFTVRVDVDGGSRARVVTGRPFPTTFGAAPINGDPACCGSTIGNVTTVPVHGLKRSITGGGFMVVGGGSQRDLYPPNQVTDFRAEPDGDTQSIIFSWTAPGDDFDMPNTRVTSYEVRYSDNREKLRDHFSDCASVSADWSQPEPSGTPSLAVINFSEVDTLFYFAIRGVDEAGNVAPLSNLARVVLPAPPAPTPVTPTGTAAPVQPTPPQNDPDYLLIILPIIAGLLLLIVLVALYLVACRRRPKKPDSVSRHQITTVTVPPAESREPTPVKISYEIEQDKPLQTISDGQTPSMWTASDILEPRARRYSPNTSSSGTDSRDNAQASPNQSYANYSNMPLNVSQLSTGRARYNSYQTPYVEDMQYDGRSLVSTQPSDSFLSLASDPRHRGNNPASEPAGGGGGGDPAQWHSDKDSLVQPGPAQRGRQGRVPPPTLPKPRMPAPLDVASSHGSRASIAGDRRRRNVTQV